MSVAQESVTGVLRVLSDETRLRILLLVSQVELAVGEIARCLAMGQSRVSNHLKILREVGLLGERHEGSYTFCRIELREGAAASLWQALAPSLEDLDQRQADQARLAVVLAERTDSRAFFDRIAGSWDVIGSDFSRGTGRLEVLSSLVPAELVVADVGCGTGYLASALGRRVARVICIDSSPAMLGQAERNLTGMPATGEFRIGSIESLPCSDGEVDVACAHMVLHHVASTRTAAAELARIVRPGGRVICLDMLPHHETWMREAMADTRLGIDPATLAEDLTAAGLVDVRHDMLSDRYVVENPAGRPVQLPLYLAEGRRPATHGTDPI